MPTDILDGILGLEGVHAIGPVTMNDLSVNPAVTPRWKVDTINGIHDLAQKDDNRGMRTGRKGEQAYHGELRGRNITYAGRAQAPTLQLLRRMVREARSAFSTDDELYCEVSPQPAYGGVSWAFLARVTAFVCDDNLQSYGPDTVPTRFQRQFTLTVRQSDPRYYLQPEHSAGPFADGDTVTIHNAGDIDTELTIQGNAKDATNIRFRNWTTPTPDASVQLKQLASGLVVFDSYYRRITVDGNARPDLYDSSAVSNWWREDLPTLVVGDNSIQVTGLDGWVVNWSDASA